MKCHDCGAEVENLGYLKKHKQECPGKPPQPAFVELATTSNSLPLVPEVIHSGGLVVGPQTTAVFAVPTGFIPIAMVPEEWRVAADGQMVVLRAIGRMTAAGVVVEEVEML